MEDGASIDLLVLATVNAPYKRSISAAALAKSIAETSIDEWLVHISNFFLSLRPELIFEFAAKHDISDESIERTYAAISRASGMRNPELESTLASMAVPAR
jgi:hypothetical protein